MTDSAAVIALSLNGKHDVAPVTWVANADGPRGRSDAAVALR
jgi:hypothetical protein